MFNKFRDIGKKLSMEENKTDQPVSATPTSDKEKARKELLKVVGIISGILILIFLLILIETVIIGRIILMIR